MTKLIKFIFCILFLISCGRNEAPPQGYTRVTFNGENASGQKGILINYPLNNGLYVQVINSDVQKKKSGSFLNIADFLGKSSLILPNGRYKFFAFGYDGVATNVFHSDLFCEPFNNGADTILAGGVVNVNLILNNSSTVGKCRHPHFTASSNYFGGGATEVTQLNISLHNGPPDNSNSASSAAIDFIMPTQNVLNADFNQGTNGLEKCFVPTYPLLKVPISQHIPAKIAIHSTSSCASGVIKVIDFPNGLGNLPYGPLAGPGSNVLGNFHLSGSSPVTLNLNIQ